MIELIFKGKNESETNPTVSSISEDIYKLNIADPLKYKWSLLGEFIYQNFDDPPKEPTYNSSSNPIQTDVTVDFNSSNKGLNPRWIVIIIFIVVALICVSIFVFYKTKQYRSRTYQQNISSEKLQELEENST
jgi:hypothetical protein